MKIYLAGRYSRRLELCGYRDELEAAGHVVTSTWLRGAEQTFGRDTLGAAGESAVESGGEEATELRGNCARVDYHDVLRSEVCVCFTEAPGSGASRGGRHVELGIALARGKRVIVVGYRENVFCCLPWVRYFKDWSEAKGILCNG